MATRWVVLGIINGTYSKLSNGETAYFEKYEWANKCADYCNKYYSCINRFEIIELEVTD
jgi:hypothetical protein